VQGLAFSVQKDVAKPPRLVKQIFAVVYTFLQPYPLFFSIFTDNQKVLSLILQTEFQIHVFTNCEYLRVHFVHL